MNCPKCPCRSATARVLLKGDAEFMMQRMAQDLRKQRPDLTLEEAKELAIASILTKRPQLLAKCDGCGEEWFE